MNFEVLALIFRGGRIDFLGDSIDFFEVLVYYLKHLGGKMHNKDSSIVTETGGLSSAAFDNDPDRIAPLEEKNADPETVKWRVGEKVLRAAKPELGPVTKHIGEKIEFFQDAKGLNTTKLAKQARLAQSHLRDIELGNKIPTVDTMGCICETLNISLAEFFDETFEKALREGGELLAVYRLNEAQKSALRPLLKTMLGDTRQEGAAPYTESRMSEGETSEFPEVNNNVPMKDGSYMNVGARIKLLEKEKGFSSTTALANKAGLAQSHLRDIELNEKNPTIKSVEFICDALGITVAEFFAEQTQGSLKDDETLRAIRQLDDEQKSALLSFLKTV